MQQYTSMFLADEHNTGTTGFPFVGTTEIKVLQQRFSIIKCEVKRLLLQKEVKCSNDFDSVLCLRKIAFQGNH